MRRREKAATRGGSRRTGRDVLINPRSNPPKLNIEYDPMQTQVFSFLPRRAVQNSGSVSSDFRRFMFRFCTVVMFKLHFNLVTL